MEIAIHLPTGQKVQLNIVIVNYNSGNHLRNCLEAIYKSNGLNIPYMITVYDNASSDNSARIAENSFPLVHYIYGQRNVGFAKAVNTAVKKGKGEYILLLNPDVTLFPRTVKTMIKFMDMNPRCAVSGGEILSPFGYREPTCRRFPNYLNVVFGRRSLVRRIFPRNPCTKAYLCLNLDYMKPQKVDFVEGSLMLIKRSALEEIGFFDEQFFLYVEDADMCYRMQQHGWETWWVPRAYAVHLRGENIRKDNIHPAMHHSKGFYKYFSKHLQPSEVMKLFLKLFLALRLTYVISTGSVKKVFYDIHSAPPR